jgi:hypothetical protein
LLKLQTLSPVAWRLKSVSTDKKFQEFYIFKINNVSQDHLCGLVVRLPDYRSRGPGLIPGATRFSEK